MFPKYKRTKLGPTRYVPRCNASRDGQPCNKPLPPKQHTGICADCRSELLALLRLEN